MLKSDPTATWCQVRLASGRQLIQDAQTGQFHSVSPHLRLLQNPSEPVSQPGPVQVICSHSSRPRMGPGHQSAQLDSPLYLQGKLWSPHHLPASLGVWGWGSQPAYGQRLRLIFFVFFVGGSAIYYTYMQRKKPQATDGRLFTAEAVSYRHNLERGNYQSLQKFSTSSKTSRAHVSWSPNQSSSQGSKRSRLPAGPEPVLTHVHTS